MARNKTSGDGSHHKAEESVAQLTENDLSDTQYAA